MNQHYKAVRYDKYIVGKLMYEGYDTLGTKDFRFRQGFEVKVEAVGAEEKKPEERKYEKKPEYMKPEEKKGEERKPEEPKREEKKPDLKFREGWEDRLPEKKGDRI